MIELLPGQHIISDDIDIKHSIQIAGKGDDVVIISDEYKPSKILVWSSDVRIANLEIGLIEVDDEGRLWADEIIFNGTAGITVHCDTSAVIIKCKFTDSSACAIQIDPQAKEVLVSNCSITGSGAGGAIYDKIAYDGEYAAIEVSAYNLGQQHDRSSSVASVKLTLRENVIDSCTGPAVCYRRNYGISEEKMLAKFKWPGNTEILFEGGNTIHSNNLDTLQSSDGAASAEQYIDDGEVIVLNEFERGEEFNPDYESSRSILSLSEGEDGIDFFNHQFNPNPSYVEFDFSNHWLTG